MTLEGAAWFVAADVCRCLGIHVMPNGEVNTTEALRKLAADEATFYQIEGGGQRRRVRVISESGLYKLIMRSDKPEARAFQDWVTRDVLPAIRKDGVYVMGEEKVRTGERRPDFH